MRFVLPLMLATLAIATSSATSGAAAPKRAAPSRAVSTSAITAATFKVERVKLANGLTILTHEDHSVPTVTFWQWFKVGSRNEKPGITGISHFFEHMMFNGSKNVAPKEYDRILESNGGYSNAFTSNDMTAYYEDIASQRLDVLFNLDSDRMASLSLLPEQLKSEIEVVKEERRLRTDNDIAGMLDEQLYATAFVAGPYSWPVIGWMKDLDRVTREDCVEYFRTFYAPNNCILVLVGDFDTKAAVAQIEKSFGAIPAQAPPAEPFDAEPEQHGERRVDVHYPAEVESFQIGYKAPSVKSDDPWVLDVISTILSNGESSRLHEAMVVDQQIALDASAYFRARMNPGLFEFYVEMRPGKTAAEGQKSLQAVIDKFVKDGPSERELQKAKNILEANFVKGLKTNNGAGRAIGYAEHVLGNYERMYETPERYRKVTAQDVKRVASGLFVPNRRTVAVLIPESREGAGGNP